jgi:hypothetical protein
VQPVGNNTGVSSPSFLFLPPSPHLQEGVCLIGLGGVVEGGMGPTHEQCCTVICPGGVGGGAGGRGAAACVYTGREKERLGSGDVNTSGRGAYHVTQPAVP